MGAFISNTGVMEKGEGGSQCTASKCCREKRKRKQH